MSCTRRHRTRTRRTECFRFSRNVLRSRFRFDVTIFFYYFFVILIDGHIRMPYDFSVTRPADSLSDRTTCVTRQRAFILSRRCDSLDDDGRIERFFHPNTSCTVLLWPTANGYFRMHRVVPRLSTGTYPKRAPYQQPRGGRRGLRRALFENTGRRFKIRSENFRGHRKSSKHDPSCSTL